MEQWFQNTRGLVIIILAVITGVVLLAIEPGDGFPTAASSASGGDTATVTTVTTHPAVDHHDGAGAPHHPGGFHRAGRDRAPAAAQRAGLQRRCRRRHLRSGTKAQVIAFQTAKGITPADGVVNAATWTALLAAPNTAATTTTVAK